MTRARKTNVFFLGLVSFYIIVSNLCLPLLPKKYLNTSLLIVLSQLFVLLPGVIYVLASRAKAIENVKCRWIGWGNSLLLILVTIAMVPVISLINAFSMMFAKNHMVEYFDNLDNNPLLLNLFLMAFLPAFVEEITFRGILYSGYRSSTIKRAMLASGFAFGLFHMNVNQFCYAAFMGIVFTLLYEATGSILSPMLVHFTFNANSLILEKVLGMAEKWIGRLSQNEEDMQKVAEKIQDNKSTASFADYPVVEKIKLLLSLLPVSVIGGTIAVVLVTVIAKRLRRINHLKLTAASLIGIRVFPRPLPGEYTEPPQKVYGGKILDGFYILAAALCVLMML